MRSILLAGAALLASTAMSEAGDFGPMNAVNNAFNGAAKSFGADARMLLVACSTEHSACQYSVSGNMVGIAKTEAGSKGRAGTIAFLYGKDSQAEDFIVALGVAMIAWSPRADKAERGLALTSLSQAVTNDEAKEIVLDGTRYKLVSVKAKNTIVLTLTRN